MTDQAWLREFGETGSEEAFARVVRAYADLVYTTARRQVGNVHLAEDVTQAVFIILAKSARKMGRERVLAGWLIRTTYFAAAHARRAEGRRRRHERRAAAMRSEVMAETGGEEVDEGMRAAVERALAKLPRGYRDVIVLRYWESKSFEEVSAVVGIGEATARKRLERGLAKLRRMLGRGGEGVSAERLEGVLTMPRMGAAPAGLVMGLAAKALAGAKGVAVVGGGVSAGVSISKGAMVMMMWTKVKVAVVAVIGILLVSGGTVVVREMGKAKEVEVAAPGEGGGGAGSGAAAARSGPRSAGRGRGAAAGPAVKLRVVDEAGKPVAGVVLRLFEDMGGPPGGVPVDQIKAERVTGADGVTAGLPNFRGSRVAVQATAAGYATVYLHGVDITNLEQFSIVLRRGNAVKGVVKDEKGAAVAGATVRLQPEWFSIGFYRELGLTTQTGVDGGFDFGPVGEGNYDATVEIPAAAGGGDVKQFGLFVPGKEEVKPLDLVAKRSVVLKVKLSLPEGLSAERIAVNVTVDYPYVARLEGKLVEGGFEVTGIPAGSSGGVYLMGDKIRQEPYAGYGFRVLFAGEHSHFTAGVQGIRFQAVPAGTYEVGTVEFLPHGIVKGVVRDEDGNPVEGASITVDSSVFGYIANGAGEYTAGIPAKLPGRISVYGPSQALTAANGPRYERLTGPVVTLEPGQEMVKDFVLKRIVVPPPQVSVVKGRVVGADGNGVAGVEVVSGNGALMPNTDMIRQGTKSWTGGYSVPMRTKTKEDGSFAFDQLFAGTTDVWVRDLERGGAWMGGVKTDGKEVELKLGELSERVRYRGMVRDATGKPAAGVPVFLMLNPSAFVVGVVMTSSLVGQTVTDGEGRFEVGGDAAREARSELQVVAMPKQGAMGWRVVPRMMLEGVEIGLKEEAGIKGRLADQAGAPVGGATAAVQAMVDPLYGGLSFRRAGYEVLQPKSTTDAQGNYVMHGVPVGSIVQINGESEVFGPAEVSSNGKTAGKETVFDDMALREKSVVEGTVRMEETGEAVAGARVTVETTRVAAETVTDGAGHFLVRVDMGNGGSGIGLWVRRGTGEGELVGKRSLDVRLQPGGRLAGFDVTMAPTIAARQVAWKQKGNPSPLKGPMAVVAEIGDATAVERAEREDRVTATGEEGKKVWEYREAKAINSGILRNVAVDGRDQTTWVLTRTGVVHLTRDGTRDWMMELDSPTGVAVDPESSNAWVIRDPGDMSKGLTILNPRGEVVKVLNVGGRDIAYSEAEKCFWVVGRNLTKVDAKGEIVTLSPVAFTSAQQSIDVNQEDGTVWILQRAVAGRGLTQAQAGKILHVGRDGRVEREIAGIGRSLVVDGKRGAIWMGPELVKMDFEGKVMAKAPVEADGLALERETGYVWAAGQGGVFRVDDEGRYVGEREVKSKGHSGISTIGGIAVGR